MLIDDKPEDRAAIAAALASSQLAYSLVEAADAEAGLAAVKTASFDCVLLDGALSAVDLADYVALLTSAEGGRQAVIALDDGADHDTAPDLLRAGAIDSIARGEADPQSLARAIRYATARRDFVIELQAAREDAEAKSRALDQLNRQTTLILSIIAHDLRNPFQALLGMSEMLLTDAGDPQAAARRAAVLYEAAFQAHGLLESLFAWANLRMDARREKAPLAVEGLFDDCARALRARADAKGVRLETQPTTAQVFAQADAEAAILRNLVANALKFTDAGGLVTLSAERRGGRIALCVADTGVGMSEGQVAKLFQIGDRTTSTGTVGERGAGLGLLLCRDLADWVGAELEVESELGRGTTFRLIQAAAV